MQLYYEQLNQKLESRLQQIEQVQNGGLKFYEQSSSKTQENVTLIRDQFTAQLQQLTEQISELKSQGEEFNLKISTISRSAELQPRIKIQEPDVQKLNLIEIDLELRNLRNLMAEEKSRRENQISEQQSLTVYMQKQIQSQENQMLDRIKQARQDHLGVMVVSTGEKAQQEKLTRETVDKTYQVVSNAIQSLDRKIEDEIQFRLREQEDMRQLVDQRIALIKQEQKFDQENWIEREKRMMFQLQQGINSIGEIIKQVKDQQSMTTKEISDVTFQSIETCMTKVNQISESVDMRLNTGEKLIQELSQKMDTLQDQALKHARATNETVAKEFARTEKIISTLEQYQAMTFADLRAEQQQQTSENLNWQSNFEQLQQKRLQENHNAMLQLNQSLQLLQTDTKDKFDVVANQLQHGTQQLRGQIQDLKMMAKTTTSTEVREIMIQATSQPAKKQVEHPDTSLLMQQIDMKVTETCNQLIRRAAQKQSEADTLLEGRAAAFSVEIESRCLKKFQEFKNYINSDEKQLQVAKTIKLMEDQIKRFNDEYEQKYVQAQIREEETQARIQSLVKSESAQLKSVLDQKLKENEELLIRLQLKHQPGDAIQNQDLNQLREQKHVELIQTVVETSKIQILTQVRQEFPQQIKKENKILEDKIQQISTSVLKRLDMHERTTQDEYVQLKNTIETNKNNFEQQLSGLNSIISEQNHKAQQLEKSNGQIIEQFQLQAFKIQKLESIAQNDEMKKDMEQIKLGFGQLQSKALEFDTKLDYLAQSNKQTTDQVLQVSQNVVSLQKDIQETKTTVQINSELINESTKKINDHTNNLEDIDKQITLLMTSDDKLSKAIADTNKLLDEERDKRAALESQNDSNQMINELSGVVTDLAQQVANLGEKVKIQAEQQSEISTTFKTLALEVQRIQSEELKLGEAVKNLQPKDNEQEEKVQQRLTQVDQRLEQILKDQQQFNKDQDQVKQVDKKFEEVETTFKAVLKSELDEVHQTYNSLQGNLLETQHQAADLRVTVDAIEKQANENRALINQMATSLAELKQKQ